MSGLLAAVQTANDASGGNLLVAVMVVAVLILVIAVSGVGIRREWLATRRDELEHLGRLHDPSTSDREAVR